MKTLKIFSIFLIISYIIVAFIVAEANPFEWDKGLRLTLVGMAIVCLLLYNMSNGILEDDNNQ